MNEYYSTFYRWYTLLLVLWWWTKESRKLGYMEGSSGCGGEDVAHGGFSLQLTDMRESYVQDAEASGVVGED